MFNHNPGPCKLFHGIAINMVLCFTHSTLICLIYHSESNDKHLCIHEFLNKILRLGFVSQRQINSHLTVGGQIFLGGCTNWCATKELTELCIILSLLTEIVFKSSL